MSTEIKVGWLTDKNGDKFSPKTLISQVQDTDGTSLRTTIDDLIARVRNTEFVIKFNTGSAGLGVHYTKFATFDYSDCTSEAGILAKIDMVSAHGNGSSYAFLQEAILKVSYNPNAEVPKATVSGDVFKYFGAASRTYDGADRCYGDIFWVDIPDSKKVDFYCCMGQYATLEMTPWKRLAPSARGTVTQYSSFDKNTMLYSSGTRVWANNRHLAKVNSVNGQTGDVKITAASLGLGQAMRFRGSTTTEISDGSITVELAGIATTDDPIVPGNVVLYEGYEFIWNGESWEKFGEDGSFKLKQEPVSDPTANGSATAFIDSISQDENGNITVTKKNVQFPTPVTDTNQTVKTGSVTFSADDVVEFVGGSNVTITGDKSKKQITISSKDTHNSHAIISGKKADGTTDIKGTASDGDITLGDSGVTAGEYGPTAAATPGYGGTFNVPDIKVNAKGIVTAISNKTVKIPAAPDLSGYALLNASNTFSGEQKMVNPAYAPTMNDIASGIGCSLKNSRACDNQLIVAELFAPSTAASDTKLNMTSTAGELPVYGITEIADGGIKTKTLYGKFTSDGWVGGVRAPVYKCDLTKAAIQPGYDNEINFGSNANYIYFGYSNRIAGSTAINTYKFGTHSGVEGATKGIIECGTVRATSFEENGTSLSKKYLPLSGGTMSGPITYTLESNGGSQPNNYVSAGGGYSINSGKYGIKFVCCDQSDCQSGLGQDLTGLPNGYELTLAGGRNAAGDTGYISFAMHSVNSTSYDRLGYFNNAGEFYTKGTIYEGGTALANKYVGFGGGTLSGNLIMYNNNPHIGLRDSTTNSTAYFQTYNDGSGLKAGFGFGWDSSLKITTSGVMQAPGADISGTANATIFKIANKVELKYDSTNECVNFVFN